MVASRTESSSSTITTNWFAGIPSLPVVSTGRGAPETQGPTRDLRVTERMGRAGGWEQSYSSVARLRLYGAVAQLDRPALEIYIRLVYPRRLSCRSPSGVTVSLYVCPLLSSKHWS